MDHLKNVIAILEPAKIPSDWGQEWLQTLLDDIFNVYEDVEILNGSASVILKDLLTEQDINMAVDDELEKISNAAQSFMTSIEEAYNYLDVSEHHIGPG